MGSGTSNPSKPVNQKDTGQVPRVETVQVQHSTKSESLLDDDPVDNSDDAFQPNFTEFPSHVSLRQENLRYTAWKKRHPQAAPLHPGYPDPSAVRKRDIAHLIKDFVIADDRALNAPRQYLEQSLDDLVMYLVHSFKDDLRKARVLFRWICAQDLSGINDEGPDESAHYYLFGVKCGMISYSELLLLLCSIAKLECKMIEGVTKASQYNAGDEVNFEENMYSNWNAVKIQQSWHLVDVNFASCFVNKGSGGWDLLDDNGEGSRAVQDEPQQISYQINEFYFMADPEEFIYNHFPAEEAWQLLARPVTKQEFQNMAYLKTGFFEMDMDCLQERRCTLHSQSEETLLKLGLPKYGQRHFAYQLWKSSKDGNWDFNDKRMAQFVFLEQREGEVIIKVVYPVTGKYTLSLFVNDNASGSHLSYSWAGDYLLICEHNKHGVSALPANSRYEWGPGHDTQKLGMTPVTHKHGTIETNDGEAEVVFKLGTLVDTLTKLRRETTSEELLQQSVLHRQEDGKLIINARLQDKGAYALDIYAKQKDEEGSDDLALVCTYLVNASSAVLDQLRFPQMDNQCVGALDGNSKFHIIPVSHKKAYFMSEEGFENIIFKYSSELSFMVNVFVDYGNGKEKLENHTFIEQTDSLVTFKLRFPKAGIYSVMIHAKERSDSGPYTAVYNYIIHVPVRMKNCSPFPIQYLRLGCQVAGLESGYLVEDDRVNVEVVVPGAVAVAAIKGGKNTQFTKGTNDNWSSEVHTGKAGENLKLSAQLAKETSTMECLFEYQVKEKQELEAIRVSQEEQFQNEQKKHEERQLQKKKKAEKFENLQQELKAAIESEDLSRLRKAVKQVEDGCYTNKMRDEYNKAKDLIKSLERIEKLKKSILQMNHSTMAEIRSYNHPPKGVHETMMATHLLLKKHEGLTKDWKQCQALSNTSVLSKAVAAFNVKVLHPEIAARALVLLRSYRIEDIALKSAGAAAFYSWVVGMTEELNQMTDGGVKKAVPALIKRQKEIFKS